MTFDFTFPLAAPAKVSCDAIAKEMIDSFAISADEAVGRINQHWNGQAFLEPDEVDGLMHELSSYWARRIDYPLDIDWWVVGEEGLDPRPYP